MNPIPDEHRVQYIALALIAMATVAIGVGEFRNWIHLVDFANMFGGGGVGILTGNKLSQMTTKGGGPINNNDTTKETAA